MSYDNADDEEWDDFDDEDEGEPTIPCPHCRREVHEDSQQCPYCEQYISREDAPPGLKPWWLITGIVLCLLIVISWIMG